MELLNLNVIASKFEEITKEEFNQGFDNSNFFLGQEEDSMPEFSGNIEFLYDEKIPFRCEMTVCASGLLQLDFYFQKIMDFNHDYVNVENFNKNPLSFFTMSIVEDNTVLLRRLSFYQDIKLLTNEYRRCLKNFKDIFDDVVEVLSK